MSVDAPQPSSDLLTGIMGVIGMVVVGLISFFGGRGSVQAQIQTALNNTFQNLVDQLQEERKDERQQILEMRGAIRAWEQHLISLENILRREGIDIPPRPVVATVFVLDSLPPSGDDKKN